MADKSYTTELKLETFLNEAITTGQANDYILATQDFIDKYTQRNFKADTSASIKLYDGNDTPNLLIDDCVEISEVKRGLDEYGDQFETISAGGYTGYYTLPNNTASGKPINEVHLRGRNWVTGLRNCSIKAKWGFSTAVPDDVSFAATIIAAGMYKFYRGGGSGNIKSEAIGNYSVSYDTKTGWDEYERARKILNNYKRFYL